MSDTITDHIALEAEKYEFEVDLHDPSQEHACQHVFADGGQCYGVAGAGDDYCRWHLTVEDRERRRVSARSKRTKSRKVVEDLEIPMIEDPFTLQVALNEVMDAIIDDRIDNRRAGLLLYALQVSRSNIRHRINFVAPGPKTILNLEQELQVAARERYVEAQRRKQQRAQKKPPQSQPAPAITKEKEGA